MSANKPTRIEDLPPEAQIPVLVRELFALSAAMRVRKQEVDDKFAEHAGYIDQIRMFNAKLVGMMLAGGAAGGGVSWVLSHLTGGG